MAKLISLTVDNDADVVRGIERDLRSHYGAQYRVLTSDSPEEALDLLNQLKLRSDSVALLLADQRMPRMDSVQFLQKAREIFPEVKRALLIAYADTNAAISAINEAGINYFFLKPWDPPEEHLSPQLDDLLDDWQASYRPPFEGIRVLGTRWSPRSYELRDFLVGRSCVGGTAKATAALSELTHAALLLWLITQLHECGNQFLSLRPNIKVLSCCFGTGSAIPALQFTFLRYGT